MGRASWVSLIALAIGLSAGAEAQDKRAFIAGVGDYEELDDLEKTLGDARGYAEVFEEDLGFEVTLLENPGRVEFITAFDAFQSSIAPGDDVAFIFSGHGWSDGSENYLVLSDAEQDASEIQLTLDTVAVTRTVLENIRARQPRVTLAIIDACRDYPFASITRSGFERGLVRTEASEGTMVMYAAGAHQKALDRLGNDDPSPYSVFTRVLLPKLRQDDRPLHDIAREVKTEVRTLAEEIDHDQNPAYYDELLGDFCLSGECREAEPGGMDADTVAFTEATARVGTAQGCTALIEYLDDFPDGKHRSVARILLSQPECDFLVESEDVADPDSLAMLELDYEKNFGGRGNDRFDAVAPLTGGGAWLVGYSFDPEIQKQAYKGGGRGPGVYAVRVSAEGRLQASKKVMEGYFITDVVTAPAADDGVWIAGGLRKSEDDAGEQLIVLRVDASGELMAREYIDSQSSLSSSDEVEFVGRTINRATQAIETSDGGILIAGMRILRGFYKSPEGEETAIEARLPLFIRLDPDGKVLAEQDYDDGYQVHFSAMVPDGEDGAYIAGYGIEGLDDDRDTFVAQISSDGTADGWSLYNDALNAQSIIDIAKVDGGIAVLSLPLDAAGEASGEVYLLSAYGFEDGSDPLWQAKIAKTGALRLSGLESLDDGGVVALGTWSDTGAVYAKSDRRPAWTGIGFEIDAAGEIVDEFTFASNETETQAIVPGPDGRFWIAGFTGAQASNTGTQDAYVARLTLD